MTTRVDLEYNIASVNLILYDYIEYIDSLEFFGVDLKEYTTSETLVASVKKSAYNSVQYLEEQKKESLKEYSIVLPQDTTILDLCFQVYNVVNDENIERLIVANDLMAYDRTDIDPNDPVLRKGIKIIYYR